MKTILIFDLSDTLIEGFSHWFMCNQCVLTGCGHTSVASTGA
jgi:hypothetical protein